MAATCKNCARPVRFDPATQKVVCDFCGGSFVPEEIEEYGKNAEKLWDSKYSTYVSDFLSKTYLPLINKYGKKHI